MCCETITSLIAAAKTFRGSGRTRAGGTKRAVRATGRGPVYPQLAALDTLDYAERTLWSDTLAGGGRPARRPFADG